MLARSIDASAYKSFPLCWPVTATAGNIGPSRVMQPRYSSFSIFYRCCTTNWCYSNSLLEYALQGSWRLCSIAKNINVWWLGLYIIAIIMVQNFKLVLWIAILLAETSVSANTNPIHTVPIPPPLPKQQQNFFFTLCNPVMCTGGIGLD